MDLNMADLIDAKSAALAEQQRTVDFNLLRPSQPKNKFSSIASIAINVFRQYVSDELDADRLSGLGTKYAAPYRQIERGSIPDAEFEAEEHFPLASQMKPFKREFEDGMRNVLQNARSIVAPLPGM